MPAYIDSSDWPPRGEFGHHGVGERADGMQANLTALLLGEKARDLARRHVTPCAPTATILSSRLVKRASRYGTGGRQRLVTAGAVTTRVEGQRSALSQHWCARLCSITRAGVQRSGYGLPWAKRPRGLPNLKGMWKHQGSR